MNVNTFSKLCSVVGIVAVAFTISGCNINQTNEQSAQVMGQLSPKVQGMLHRQNTSEAIDVEFAKRFDDKMAQAKKLVTVDGDTITVKHKFGTTVMPKTHQRIVVIRMEDPILALDVPFLAGITTLTIIYTNNCLRRILTSSASMTIARLSITNKYRRKNRI